MYVYRCEFQRSSQFEKIENSVTGQIKGPKMQAQNLYADFLKCEGRMRIETPSSLPPKVFMVAQRSQVLLLWRDGSTSLLGVPWPALTSKNG